MRARKGFVQLQRLAAPADDRVDVLAERVAAGDGEVWLTRRARRARMVRRPRSRDHLLPYLRMRSPFSNFREPVDDAEDVARLTGPRTRAEGRRAK